jgi:hypothetical protein
MTGASPKSIFGLVKEAGDSTCLFERLHVRVHVFSRHKVPNTFLNMGIQDGDRRRSMDSELASKLQGGVLRQLSNHFCKEWKQAAHDVQ